MVLCSGARCQFNHPQIVVSVCCVWLGKRNPSVDPKYTNYWPSLSTDLSTNTSFPAICRSFKECVFDVHIKCFLKASPCCWQPLTLKINYSKKSMTRTPIPESILHKSIAGRDRPVRVTDGPITARCRFIKNVSWDGPFTVADSNSVFSL